MSWINLEIKSPMTSILVHKCLTIFADTTQQNLTSTLLPSTCRMKPNLIQERWQYSLTTHSAASCSLCLYRLTTPCGVFLDAASQRTLSMKLRKMRDRTLMSKYDAVSSRGNFAIASRISRICKTSSAVPAQRSCRGHSWLGCYCVWPYCNDCPMFYFLFHSVRGDSRFVTT